MLRRFAHILYSRFHILTLGSFETSVMSKVGLGDIVKRTASIQKNLRVAQLEEREIIKRRLISRGRLFNPGPGESFLSNAWFH